jgi:uncharacterized membrane protein
MSDESRTGPPSRPPLCASDDAIARCQDAAWGFVSPGETRWPSAASILAVIVLQLILPERLTLGPTWMLPAIEGFVLLTLIVVGPSRLDAQSKDVRYIALTLIGILILANGTTLATLMHLLLRNGQMINGRVLIYSAVAVWFTSIVSFALLYWELDRGGPIARCTVDHSAPDLMFVQMQNPTSTPTPWTPRYIDYLYLSLTNSTAFSPTDVLPLTSRAKCIMASQSLVSLATIVVVGARAVNILQ